MKRKLTHRQYEVCRLITAGKTSKEIAGYIGISPRTVEDHRAAILKALRVRNAVELTLLVHGIDFEKVDNIFLKRISDIGAMR